MKAFVASLVLALLCASSADARLQWRWQFGRSLLQVTQLPAQPALQTGAAVPQPTLQNGLAAGTVTQTGLTVDPTAGTAPGAVTAQNGAAAPQPTTPAADAAAGQPADPNAPPASPQLQEFEGRSGVYVIADPPPAPKVAATPAAANKTGNVTGPPPIAAGKNLMVVLTVMGEDAKVIYKNQQAVREQLASAAGLNPQQVLFYNQTANQDPRTGNTALSLSMAVDCTTPAACARAGMTLQNTTSQTRLTDNLARSGVSLMPGTFQVFGVNELGRFKGNQTLYENKALLAPAPATTLDYNQTMARFTQPTGLNATAVPGALPGALPGTIPGLPLGNFTIPGFAPDNTSSTPTTGMQPGFNLSDFQVPTQSLLPPGAVPFGANMTQPAQEPPVPPPTRSSASSGVIGALTAMAAAAAALLL